MAEADDADGSIARIRASVSVVTNSWFDHPSLGRTQREVLESIEQHVARTPADGRVILGGGRNLLPLRQASCAPVWRLGHDLTVETVSVNSAGRLLRIVDPLGETLEAKVHLHGGNVAENAALAYAALRALAVPPFEAADALGTLSALTRRVEVVADVDGVRVFDDIGKHPEALAATLRAVRELGARRVHIVYEPFVHADVLRWQRRWADVLGSADSVIVLPVDDRPQLPVDRYAPRDWPHRAGLLADLAVDREDAAQRVVERARPGDAIVVLGAVDDLDEVAADIVNRLGGEG